MRRKKAFRVVALSFILVLVFLASTHVEPVFAWCKDSHYYLTYYLARKVSFESEEAKTIASANQYIDNDADTDAFILPIMGDPLQMWAWHAFSSDYFRWLELDRRWRNAPTRYEKLVYFGQYLHFVQDGYSHCEYDPDFIGHAKDTFAGRDPDSLANAKEAKKMVEATLSELKQLAIKLEMSYKDVQFKDIENVFNKLVRVSCRGWKEGMKIIVHSIVDSIIERIKSILQEDLKETIPSPKFMDFDSDGNLVSGASSNDLRIKELYIPAYSVPGRWINIKFKMQNMASSPYNNTKIHYGLFNPQNWSWITYYTLYEGVLLSGETRTRTVLIENTQFSEGQVICVGIGDPLSDENWDNNFQFVTIGKAIKPVDIVFLFDTTESMSDDIAAVKSAATSIVNELDSADTNVYASIATYKDFPISPYGEVGDYPFRTELKFTSNLTTVTQTIQSLTVGGGADWKESVYYALLNSIDAELLGGWRGIGSKIVIVMGDAPPHDPEPFTGYTLSDVISAALHADAVSIYTVAVGSSPSESFKQISEATNGKTFSASGASEVVDAIKAAINESVASPSPFWPMFRNNHQHTGISTSIAPKTNNTIWSFQTGLWVVSSPAVADGIVFVGSGDGNVYAIDQPTGDLIWNFTVDSAEDMRVDSSPAVADGMVFVGSNNGRLYALAEATGEPLWVFNASDGINSSPVVVDGMVIFGWWNWPSPQGKVFALDQFSGETLWTYETGGIQLSSPAVANGRVFIGSVDGKIYALNESTGNYSWSYATVNETWSSPAVSDGMVYVGSHDGNLYALNATNGNLVWNHQTGNKVISSPAITEDLVIVGVNWAVLALNKTNGNTIWSSPTTSYMFSSPAVSGDTVFIGGEDGKLWALNVTNGQPIWSYQIGSSIRSSPAIGDGMIFVGADDGKIYAFGPPPPPPSFVYNFTLNITTTIGGSTNPPPGSYKQPSGAIITAEAYPSTGYILDHWELDSINVGATNPISVTMISDHTLYAVFIYGPIHDVAVIGLVATKTTVQVTLENQGDVTETFDVSADYTRIEDPSLGTKTVTLASGATTKVDFQWTPSYGRYEIQATASIVSGETDTADNTRKEIVYIQISLSELNELIEAIKSEENPQGDNFNASSPRISDSSNQTILNLGAIIFSLLSTVALAPSAIEKRRPNFNFTILCYTHSPQINTKENIWNNSFRRFA